MDLPGLALWLKGDTGIVDDPAMPGMAVKWLDQSGNGNTVTFNGDKPIDVAAVNARDAVFCGGSISDSTSLQWGTGDFAVALVIKTIASGSFYYDVFRKSGAPNADLLLQCDPSTGFFKFSDGLSNVGLLTQTQIGFHALIVRGTKLDIVGDGSSVSGPTATTDIGNVGSPVDLCGNSNAAQMEAAEVIAVKGVLSDADRTKLEAYFHNRYNL